MTLIFLIYAIDYQNLFLKGNLRPDIILKNSHNAIQLRNLSILWENFKIISRLNWRKMTEDESRTEPLRFRFKKIDSLNLLKSFYESKGSTSNSRFTSLAWDFQPRSDAWLNGQKLEIGESFSMTHFKDSRAFRRYG